MTAINPKTTAQPENAAITILCAERLLLSTFTHLQLYAIPKFHEDRSRGKYTPLAVCDIGTRQPDWTSIWSNLCPHYKAESRIYGILEKPVEFWNHNANSDSHIVILPPKEKFDHAHALHAIDHLRSISPSRMLWYHSPGRNAINLTGCTYFAAVNDHPGYMRLERLSAPDPSYTTCMTLFEEDKELKALSWDAESGRICALMVPYSEKRKPKTLLIGDLL